MCHNSSIPPKAPQAGFSQPYQTASFTLTYPQRTNDLLVFADVSDAWWVMRFFQLF